MIINHFISFKAHEDFNMIRGASGQVPQSNPLRKSNSLSNLNQLYINEPAYQTLNEPHLNKNYSFSQQHLTQEDDTPVQTRTNLMEQKKAQWMREQNLNTKGGAAEDNWPFGKPGPGAGPNRQRQQQIEDTQNANPFMHANQNSSNRDNQVVTKSKKYIDKLKGNCLFTN